MRATRVAFACASTLLFVAAACGQDFVRPPVARIDLSPPTVPYGDAMSTDVTLDGRLSEDTFNDPRNPLVFAWSFDGPFQVTTGAIDRPMLTARFLGDRPVGVTLTVTNPLGKSASAQASVGVSVPAP